jgi:thiol-disulfide isomerase/thioredoxin
MQELETPRDALGLARGFRFSNELGCTIAPRSSSNLANERPERANRNVVLDGLRHLSYDDEEASPARVIVEGHAMRSMTAHAVTLFAASFAAGAHAAADEPTAQHRPERPGVAVRLVDPSGRPVDGAEVGLDAAFGDANFRETPWEYVHGPARSGRDGLARLDVEVRVLNGLAVTARHRERRLIAIENLDPAQMEHVPTLTLRPECRVVGRMRCEELEERGVPLRGISANVSLGSRLAAEYWSMEPVFEFFLPPGEYELKLRSERSGMRSVVRSLVVPKNMERLDLSTIELPLAGYSRMKGSEAAELRGVAAWKGGSPGRFADLRGKVILLDFWGWWCGSCVQEMPELFRLHDTYHDKGLVIIGVHVNYDEEQAVATPVELDRKLKSARDTIWKGRDLPFPIALTTPGGQESGEDAYCAAAADYGIENYPTKILIDKRGRVVGRVGRRDLVARIEAALAER